MPSLLTAVPPTEQAESFVLPRVSITELARDIDASQWPACPARPIVLQQCWLPMPQRTFQPGTVWLAATDDALLVFAKLTGSSARTTATKDNQWLWELGDVFEIFIQSYGGDEYFEFQIAPNGRLLQLHYPSACAPRQSGIDQYLRSDRLIEFASHHDAETRDWRIAARVPVATILPARKIAAGAEWRIACCRYDYAADGSFVLSSTAHLRRPDFHRIGEWSRISIPGGFPAPTA